MTENRGSIFPGAGGDLLDVLLLKGVLSDEQFDRCGGSSRLLASRRSLVGISTEYYR